MRVITLSSGLGWHLRDLQRAAEQLQIDLQPRFWRELQVHVPHPSSSPPPLRLQVGDLTLRRDDCLLIRTMSAGTLEEIVMRMDGLQLAQQQGLRILNSPRAVETAVDKLLTTVRLAQAGLPTPATCAVQRLEDGLHAFDLLGNDVLIKPLFGSEGFGITRITDRDALARVLALLDRMRTVIYLQQFIPHPGCDLRLLVMGEQVVTGMRRQSTDWKTNIATGAVGQPLIIEEWMRELALRSARACGCDYAGVDLLVGTDGSRWVLEVNAVPGWRELSRVTQVDVARHLLQWVTGTMA